MQSTKFNLQTVTMTMTKLRKHTNMNSDTQSKLYFQTPAVPASKLSELVEFKGRVRPQRFGYC